MQSMKQNVSVKKKFDPTVSSSKKTSKKDINPKSVTNVRKDNTVLGLLQSVPKGVDPQKKAEYEYVLKWLCQDREERKEKSFLELSRTLNISERTLYNWLNLKDTEAYVNEYIRKLYIAEKPRLFKIHLKQAEKSAHFARFVAEYYENWMGAKTSARPITVVFNFGQDQQKKNDDQNINDKVTVEVKEE